MSPNATPHRHQSHEKKDGALRTYVGRLERGETGVTVEALAAILVGLGVSLCEFFKPFRNVGEAEDTEEAALERSAFP